MLECSFWGHCTSTTVLTLHFFHPIHTKTTVCFTQVALKPTKLIITTENTEINLFLVQQQLLSSHPQENRIFHLNQHVGGLVRWLLLGPYLCMLFEFVCYLNEWLNTYIFCRMLNLSAILFGHDLSTKLFFFLQLNFFQHQNTKHKIFRDEWQIHLWHWQLWEKCCSK